MSTFAPVPTDLDLDFVQSALSAAGASPRANRLQSLASSSGTPGVLAALTYHGWTPDRTADCPTIFAYLPESDNWKHSGASSLKALLALGRDSARVRDYMMFLLTPGPGEPWVSRGAPPLPNWVGVGGAMSMSIRLSDWAVALTRLGRASPLPLPPPSARPAWVARMDAWADAPEERDVRPDSVISGFQDGACPSDGDQLSPLEFLVLTASRTTSLAMDHVGRPLLSAVKSGHRFHRAHWTLSDRETHTPFTVPWSDIIPWAMDQLVAEKNLIAASALWQAWCRDRPIEAGLMCTTPPAAGAPPRPARWPDWCAALDRDRQALIQSPQAPFLFFTHFRELLDIQERSLARPQDQPAPGGRKPKKQAAALSDAAGSPALPSNAPEDPPSPTPPTPAWFSEVLEEIESLPVARRARQNAVAFCKDWLAGYHLQTKMNSILPRPNFVAAPSRPDMYRALALRALSGNQASLLDVLCKTGLDFRHIKNCLTGTLHPSCWITVLQNGWDPNDLHEAGPAIGSAKRPMQVPCWTTLLILHIHQKPSTHVVCPADRAFWRALLPRVQNINQTDLSDFPHILLKLDRLKESRALGELVRLILKEGADPRVPCGTPARPVLEQIASPWLLATIREELAARDHALLSAVPGRASSGANAVGPAPESPSSPRSRRL